MNTLAEPPDRWDANTATPSALERGRRLASDKRMLVNAGERTESSEQGFKDRRSVPERQGGSWPALVRSSDLEGVSDEH